jgi:hypothetical protein
MVDKARAKRRERLRITEDDVGRPFAVGDGPVVGQANAAQLAERRVSDEVEVVDDVVQEFGPRHTE